MGETTGTKISAREGNEEVEIDFDAFIDGLHDWARTKIYAPLVERISALETEVQSLRQEKSAIQYLGVYQRAIPYVKGNIVTYDGSAWFKISDSKGGAPGTDNSWQLFVRKGKDRNEH